MVLRRIIFVILIFSAFFLAAEDASDRCRRFFFELWRYEYTGASDVPDIERYAGVSKAPAQIGARIMWTRRKGALPLADLLFSEYAGVWEASIPYDAAADSGDWIDSLGLSAASFLLAENPPDAAAAEMPPDAPDILSSLEKTSSSTGAMPPETHGDGNSELNSLSILPSDKHESAGKERSFTDSERALRLYVANDEAFAVQKSGSGRMAVSADRKRAVRKRYDDSMRLIAQETWDFSKGAEAAFIAKTERYFYGEKLQSAVISEGANRTEHTYDEEGRIIQTNFLMPEPDERPPIDQTAANKVSAPKKEPVLQTATRFIYNTEGKLAEKQQEKYHYKDGALLANETEKIRDVFEYKTPDAEPNHFYYENGILRMKTIYTGVDTYIASMYFDGGYSSEIHYEEGQRTKDLFFLNGTLLRSKTHE